MTNGTFFNKFASSIHLFTFFNPTVHPIIRLVPSFHHSQKQDTSDTQIVPFGGMEMEKGERSRRLVVGHDPRLQHNAISISPTPPRLHHKREKKRQNLPKQWAHTRTTLRAQTKVQSPWLPTRKRQRRGSSSDRRRRRTGRGPSRHRRRAGWWRLRFGAWGGLVFSFPFTNQKKEPKLTP